MGRCGMSNKALNYVFENSQTKGSARVLMLAIADMANDDGECWPGKAKLERKVNVSTRQLVVLIQDCERLNELRVITSKSKDNPRDNDSNRYLIVGLAHPRRIQEARKVRPKYARQPKPQNVADNTSPSDSGTDVVDNTTPSVADNTPLVLPTTPKPSINPQSLTPNIAPTGAGVSVSNNPTSPSKDSIANPKPPRKSKTPKTDESADPAAARNAGIVALIESWLKTTGTFSPNPYANKTFRGAAGMMVDAGITAADVRDFCWWHQKVDPFWKGKPLPFLKVADGYSAWRAVNPSYRAPSEAALKQAEADRVALEESRRLMNSQTPPMSAADTIKALGLTDLANKMTRGGSGDDDR